MPISPTDELGTHVAQVLSANYELESEVGRGGMGIVYCARDRRLKREIAIKVLPPELSFRADIRQRFLREAETAAQLNHPNIVPIYTVEERDNLDYFDKAYNKSDRYLGVAFKPRGAGNLSCVSKGDSVLIRDEVTPGPCIIKDVQYQTVALDQADAQAAAAAKEKQH